MKPRIPTSCTHKQTCSAAITTLTLAGAIAMGAPASDQDPTLVETVTQMARVIDENYVYPDKGHAASQLLLDHLEQGQYDTLTGPALAQKVRADLVDLTHDLHFGVRALPKGWTPPSKDAQPDPGPEPQPPFGLVDVRRIEGNIGYIDLRGFVEASYIGDTVEAAMRLMHGSGALIFDLRRNGGGDPHAVALVSSYLFDPASPVHLNSLYSRPNDSTQEFWTHGDINPDLAMPDVPVYVLTSPFTFSAAEEFTYNLKNLKRATIVGQTTGGGAHPVDPFVIDNQYMLIIPTARAINPISGTNWEGTGVSPDIECDADDALDTATAEALRLAVECGDESARWGLAQITARLHPIACDEKLISEYAGDFGPRHFRVIDTRLQYRRDGVSAWRDLICFERDQFVIDGVEGFILEFNRDAQGRVDRVTGHYQQGNTDESMRDS